MLTLTGAVMARGKHNWCTAAAPGFAKSVVNQVLSGIAAR
jgi:hypothetical protein